MQGLLLPLIGLILLSIITFSITLVGKRRRPQLPTERELQQAEAKNYMKIKITDTTLRKGMLKTVKSTQSHSSCII